MPRFSPTPAPTHTLWGAPDRAVQILPGIWEVSTPSHGGMVLSDERQAAMPEALRLDTCAYEEDVDWALVMLGFAAEFAALPARGSDLLVDTARASVKTWHPDRYGAFTGEAVDLGESPVLQRRAAYQAMIGKYVVCSASGSWADWVPDGKVGVVARRVASVDALGHARFTGDAIQGLVDKHAYDSACIVNGFDEIGAVRIDGDVPATKELVL